MKNIDLGTSIVYDEMYYNKQKQKKKRKLNTFRHQDVANVGGCAALFSPTAAPSAPGVREDQGTSVLSVGITRPKKSHDRLSKDDSYDIIKIQLAKIRQGESINRASAYISFKRDIDTKLKIKLTANLTDRKSEVIRGASERVNMNGKLIKENKYILNLVEQYKDIDGIMMGRCKYTPSKNFVSNFNKQNLPCALLVLIPNDDMFIAKLHLWTEVFEINLDEQLTTKQKEANYIANGTYVIDLPDLEDES